jgi:hypothetical protein
MRILSNFFYKYANLLPNIVADYIFDFIIGKKINMFNEIKEYSNSFGSYDPIKLPTGNLYKKNIVNKRTIVIHVGYGHTGTSSLQVEFNKLDNIIYHGKPFKTELFKKAIFEICYSNFDNYNSLRVKEIIKEQLNGFSKDNMIHLLSAEDFTTPIVGAFGFQLADPYLITERIADIFSNFNIKILFTIRKQSSILRSEYFQYKKILKAKGIKCSCKHRYLLDMLYDMRGNMHTPANIYNFNKAIPRYINFFGSENVKVLPFELFLNDKKTYFQELNHFIFNTSDYSTLTQLPRINKSKEKFWRKNALTFIHQYYQHANRDLYEKILDIKSKEANYLTKYEYF